MSSRILETFKIRPGEGRTVLLLVGMMLFTAAGSAVGGNATEALFFARFGVELLPGMYVILGLFTFLTSMVITVMMGRIHKQRLFILLPLAISLALIFERLIISLNFKWFYAVMWLGMNVIGSLQGLLTWGLASATCDTRQAKRLFSLFSAGGILGTVLGGLATQALAGWLHSENLLLIWAGTFLIAYVMGRALAGQTYSVSASAGAQQASVVVEMQRGYQFVRRSRIMQWVSFSAVLFSICFFALKLFFSRGATLQYQNADQLAGFLGLFQGLCTAAALLASLFLANRLFARFGIMPMLLLFSAIYLAGFGVLAISAPFGLLAAVRFAQMAWMAGIADPAWQAIFNVVPPDLRDQVRAFVGGVPEQAGTVVAGLVLLVGDKALQPQQMYLIGLTAALLLIYMIWRASRAYGGALVDALRAGQPQLFYSEEEPFGGFRRDAGAAAAAIHGMTDADLAVRRVSVEISGHLSSPEAVAGLVQALADGDSMVRASALRGLARSNADTARLEIAACLNDPEPEVRLQAVEALQLLALNGNGTAVYLEPLLSDSDPQVRAQAACTLLRSGVYPNARKVLDDMATDMDPRVRTEALTALGECADESAFNLAASALADPQPSVRKSAALALVSIQPLHAMPYLIPLLNEDEPSVRRTFAEALSKIGPAVVEPVLAVLNHPGYEDGALMALELLPDLIADPMVRLFAADTVQTALHYHGLALGLAQQLGQASSNDSRRRLLIEALDDHARRCGLNALRAIGLYKNRATAVAAVDQVNSREAGQRANALEILESLGEREIIRPLLVLWEAGDPGSAPLPDGWLMDLLHDPNAWLRACSVLFAAGSNNLAICNQLQSLAQSDPDIWVQEAAQKALTGETPMDTLATLSLMERILFLRHVPLFEELSPVDLKQVAAIMRESVFAADEALAYQGSPGDELYIIVSGEVKVRMAAGDDKEAREVARRFPGDYVGEMAIISREPRAATLIASGPVRTLCIERKPFESILRERPEISLGVMRVLSQRLKEASLGLASSG